MSVAIPEFWKLVIESRLLTAEQCGKLGADFGHVKGAANQSNARTLAEWLVSRNALSRYQSTVLLAGRAGPFYYGDYRVYDRVEGGPLAGQFRAIHAPTGHPVLLKFLGGSVLKDKQEWAAVAARVVRHASVAYPLVQRVYEPVDLNAFKFIASEDVRGETLEDLVAREGRLPPPEASRVMRLAAFALAAMHKQGLIHGSMRPQHLLLEPSGNVKLLVDPAQKLEPINVAQLDLNAPAAQQADYLAPEFIQPNKSPDVLTDIYALGCTFYQLLSGQPPFVGGSPQEKMARHAAQGIQPLEPFGVPHPLAQIVAFMMAKNSTVRYQQAGICAEQLASFVDPSRQHIPAITPPPTLAAYDAWIKQKQKVLSAASVKAASPPAAELPKVDIRLGAASSKPITGKAAAGTVVLDGPQVDASGASAGARLTARPSKKQAVMTWSIAGGAAVLGLIVLAIVMNSGGGTDDDSELAKKDPETTPVRATEVPETTPGNKPVKGQPVNGQPAQGGPNPIPTTDVNNRGGNTDPAPPAVAVEAPKFQVQPDDGKLLWASPTSGRPLELDWVPFDANILIAARPADILASPAGAKVLTALGPGFQAARARWEKEAGVPLNNVEQLIIGLHPATAAGQPPIPSYRVTLKTPVPTTDLLARWGNPAAKTADGVTFYDSGAKAFLAPESAGGKLFVMGTPKIIEETAKLKGAPPVLGREVNQLRMVSDADRDFTVLLRPGYLFGDGLPLFAGDFQRARAPLEWFIGDDVKSIMLSMQFDQQFYAEISMIADLEHRSALPQALKDRIEQIPSQIERYIVSLNPPEYWRAIAFRYPGMVRYLHGNTRVGLEGEVAVVNMIAPGAAAHNLIFGGELALVSTPGATVAAGGPTKPAVPKNLDELLKYKVSFGEIANDMNLTLLSFQDQVNGDVLGLPFEFKIKILGKDLEIEGITRNQKITNFEMKDQPVADILTGLVRKANPDPSATGPDDLKQKLIWVVGPDPDQADQQVVLVTTRKAAETKKYTLPPVFMPK